jgi:transposase InsO family protein
MLVLVIVPQAPAGCRTTASSGRNGPEIAATKLREWLNGEIFDALREAQVRIEQWRQHYSRARPHSAPGYRTPAPEARGLALVPRNTAQHQRAA